MMIIMITNTRRGRVIIEILFSALHHHNDGITPPGALAGDELPDQPRPRPQQLRRQPRRAGKVPGPQCPSGGQD